MNILSIQSSVAYGHAGNSSAVFPLQRLGHEVWPVFTVHFSNHTGYGEWRGPVFDPETVRDVITGSGFGICEAGIHQRERSVANVLDIDDLDGLRIGPGRDRPGCRSPARPQPGGRRGGTDPAPPAFASTYAFVAASPAADGSATCSRPPASRIASVDPVAADVAPDSVALSAALMAPGADGVASGSGCVWSARAARLDAPSAPDPPMASAAPAPPPPTVDTSAHAVPVSQ